VAKGIMIVFFQNLLITRRQ